MSHQLNDGVNTSVRQLPTRANGGLVANRAPFFAEVTGVNSDRMTCAIKSPDGSKHNNVPVLTYGGTDPNSNEQYGRVLLPQVGSSVLVLPVSGGMNQYVIAGAVLPYLRNEWQSQQTPAGTSGKAFTKKLLDAGKPKGYREVLPSGTTVEVQDDGTVIVETPSGSYIKIDEAASGDVTVEANGNTLEMTTGKVVINGNLEVLQ